jgi:hypothetical protein
MSTAISAATSDHPFLAHLHKKGAKMWLSRSVLVDQKLFTSQEYFGRGDFYYGDDYDEDHNSSKTYVVSPRWDWESWPKFTEEERKKRDAEDWTKFNKCLKVATKINDPPWFTLGNNVSRSLTDAKEVMKDNADESKEKPQVKHFSKVSQSGLEVFCGNILRKNCC